MPTKRWPSSSNSTVITVPGLARPGVGVVGHVDDARVLEDGDVEARRPPRPRVSNHRFGMIFCGMACGAPRRGRSWHGYCPSRPRAVANSSARRSSTVRTSPAAPRRPAMRCASSSSPARLMRPSGSTAISAFLPAGLHPPEAGEAAVGEHGRPGSRPAGRAACAARRRARAGAGWRAAGTGRRAGAAGRRRRRGGESSSPQVRARDPGRALPEADLLRRPRRPPRGGRRAAARRPPSRRSPAASAGA